MSAMKSKTIRRRMRGRQAVLLLLALLLALSPLSWGGLSNEEAHAAETGGTADSSGSEGGTGSITLEPTVKVVGVNVKDTDTLEVGIQVGGPDQPLFQSVGLVLEYDKSKLTPIEWEEGWKTAAASSESKAAVEIAGEENWKSLAVYTPTWINSGTAQVYEPEGGSGAGAGVESAVVAGEAERGYLLLQANTEYPYSLPTARQIVTVKFRYTGRSVSGGAITKAADFADVGLALAGSAGGVSASDQQAGKQVAFASRIGHVGLYSASNAASLRQFYHTPLKDDGSGNAADDPDPAKGRLTAELADAVAEGESQQAAGGGSGPADSSAFASLTFYDWDNTLLGTRIVAKGASLKDPNDPYADNDGNGIPDKEDYAALLAAAPTEQIGENGHLLDSVLEEKGFAPIAPEGNELYGGTDANGQPVTVKNKDGYLYAGWVDYYTGHSTPVVTDLGAEPGQTLPREGVGSPVSLKGISQSMVLKAGYDEDAAKLGASAFERRYTLDCSAFHDSGTGYAATFSLQRTSNARRSNDGEVSLQLELMDLNAAIVVLVLPCGTADAEQTSFTLPYDAMGLYDPDAAVTATIIDPDSQSLSDPLTIPAESIME